MQEQESHNSNQPKQDKDTERLLSALGYIGPLCFVPLVLGSDSEYMLFHAKQGLILFILEVIATFLAMFIIMLPFIGRFTWNVLSLIFILISLYGALKAFAGEKWEMPLLGEYAKRIKF